MGDETEKFYCVVGDRTDSTCEGRIYDYDTAIATAERWARINRGTKYYVLESVSCSQAGAGITHEVH